MSAVVDVLDRDVRVHVKQPGGSGRAIGDVHEEISEEGCRVLSRGIVEKRVFHLVLHVCHKAMEYFWSADIALWENTRL